MEQLKTIGDRIAFVASIKATSSKQFAAMVGWSQVQMCRIVNNVQGVGLVPVQRVLETFPDIDARWLIFGDGSPFRDVQQRLVSGLVHLLSYEKYIPVMTESEQLRYLNAVNYLIDDLFPAETVARWENALNSRENIGEAIDKAMKESIVKEN